MPKRAETPSSATVCRFGDAGDHSLKSGTRTVARPPLNDAATTFFPSNASVASKSRAVKFTASISTAPVEMSRVRTNSLRLSNDSDTPW